ncbi:hypothetical protein V2A60_004874 [Cordyceps javanica]
MYQNANLVSSARLALFNVSASPADEICCWRGRLLGGRVMFWGDACRGMPQDSIFFFVNGLLLAASFTAVGDKRGFPLRGRKHGGTAHGTGATGRRWAIDWMWLRLESKRPALPNKFRCGLSSFVLLAAEDSDTSELCVHRTVYRSVDPLSESCSERDAPASEGPHETPRRRFDYHVRLREIRQVEKWRRTYMNKRFYTNLETPNIPARDWVIKQWQKQGIWANTWPDTGPGDDERWNCGSPEGIPACLMSMELGWEFESIVLVQKPVLLPCLAATRARLPAGIKPVTWKPSDIGQQALSQVLARWKEEGFSSSTIQQSALEYRRDLEELRHWLPPLARKFFDSLKVFSWPDLLNGWRDKLGDCEADQHCFTLPPEQRDIAEAAVEEAQAESRRVEALRRKSPLQAPTAVQNVAG